MNVEEIDTLTVIEHAIKCIHDGLLLSALDALDALDFLCSDGQSPLGFVIPEASATEAQDNGYR